jgi:hypothetical protein
MFTADEARTMMHKDAAIQECKKRTEEAIQRAVDASLNSCCLSTTSCYLKEDGTVGNSSDRYVDCTDEIKRWLKSFGYKIKPTGYVGGILQNTEDIYW